MSRKTTHAWPATRWGLALVCVALASMAGDAAAESVTLPVVCSRGSDQPFVVGVTVPREAEAGSIYSVRIDGASSGKISHFGLNYIHEMVVEYVLPAGATYVEGSARLVPGTGTPNVLEGARVFQRQGTVTMVLPGRVENGSGYTPPGITLKLRASGAPGSAAMIAFNQYRLKVNAFLVGDLAVSCAPTPRPYPIGTTKITAGEAPRAPD